MRCGLCGNSVQGWNFDALKEGDLATLTLVGRKEKKWDPLERVSPSCLAGWDEEHCHIDNSHGGEEWIFEVKTHDVQ